VLDDEQAEKSPKVPTPRRSPRLMAQQAPTIKEEPLDEEAPPAAPAAAPQQVKEEDDEEDEDEEEEDSDDDDEMTSAPEDCGEDGIYGVGDEIVPVAKPTEEQVQKNVEREAIKKRMRADWEKESEKRQARREEKEKQRRAKLAALRQRREQRRAAATVSETGLQRQRRCALFACLKTAYKMYQRNWAKTALDILMKSANEKLDRFAAEHQPEVNEMYLATLVSSKTRAQEREQGRGIDEKEVLGDFDRATNLWAKATVSARAPVVGGGRTSQGQEGKMFDQHEGSTF